LQEKRKYPKKGATGTQNTKRDATGGEREKQTRHGTEIGLGMSSEKSRGDVKEGGTYREK